MIKEFRGKVDPNEPIFKNTFLPRCRSEYLSVNALVSFVKLGLCSLTDIPPDVKKRFWVIYETSL